MILPILRTLFVATLLGVWLSPPASAETFEPGKPAAYADIAHYPVALVTGDALNLRAEPSATGEIQAKLLRGTSVFVLRQGPAADAGANRWALVAIKRCRDQQCRSYLVGWVADSFLAFDDRFAPVEAWSPGIVAGYGRHRVFAYDVAADGSFTRWSVPCLPGMCPLRGETVGDCPDGESRDGPYCRLTGQLYQYQGFVRGRGEDGSWLDGGPDGRWPAFLWVDDSGHLCALESERDRSARMCGGGTDAGQTAATLAIAATAADLRDRLAVTAPATLNLRAEPSAEAPILAELPRGTAVEVTGEAGPAVSVGGVESRWSPVAVVDCFGDYPCGQRKVGWVADLFLAFEGRLEPVRAWRAGQLGGVVGDCGLGYTIATNGTFDLAVDCGRFGSNPGQSGQLHRYRELVRAAVSLDGWYSYLQTDERGRLCFIQSGRDGGVDFERNGHYARCLN